MVLVHIIAVLIILHYKLNDTYKIGVQNIKWHTQEEGY